MTVIRVYNSRVSLPIAMFARLRGAASRVLLHSGRDDDGCGRWSFVACEPEATLEIRGGCCTVHDDRGELSRTTFDAFAALEEFIDAAPPGEDAAGPVPSVIGYIGYELGASIEPRTGPRRDAGIPDMWFGRYPAVWRHDRVSGDADIVGVDERHRRALADKLQRPLCEPRAPVFGQLVDTGTRAQYDHNIASALELIAAGDIYQVNVARQLVAAIRSKGDPEALYQALDRESPCPFGAILETPDATLISGSPERFLSRRAGSRRMETRPIKGTRQRSATDTSGATELARDPKERAEHLMIVDLLRNDLGRVAEVGSVTVDGLGYVVELPTLYHMVSRVSCDVRSNCGTADILRATFPGGSITGAPKVRAMQIISELEPEPRGAYTGVLGYFGGDGGIELAIAIRTAVIANGELRLGIGGGIVADSQVQREWLETEYKAAGWRRALASL